jgi:hypothetical protein
VLLDLGHEKSAIQAAEAVGTYVPIIRTLYIYVNRDVRIRGYFSKPKGVREQKKSLGNTGL